MKNEQKQKQAGRQEHRSESHRQIEGREREGQHRSSA